MNKWTHILNNKANSALIYKITQIGDDKEVIAVCNGIENAALIAAAPRLLDTMRELLTAYQAERDGLIDLAENAFKDPVSRIEAYEQVAIMDELIRKTQNTISAAEGKNA